MKPMNEVQGSGKSKDFLGSLKRTSSKLEPIRRIMPLRKENKIEGGDKKWKAK